MFHGYRITPIFEVNRLLPHVDAGVPPIDLEADLHQQWAFGRQSGADASLVFEYHLGQCLFF